MLFARFSLKTSIIFGIIAMGVLGIVLALVIGSLYHQLSIENQEKHLQQIVQLQTNDILSKLKSDSKKLGQSLQSDKKFRQAFKNRNLPELNRLLTSQFHQYFVTAGITKLEKLTIYNTDLNYITHASLQNNNNGRPKPHIQCGNLITRSSKRTGAESLKAISELCNLDSELRLSVLIPIGGIFVKGYIEITTDPSYSLQKIGQNLGTPVRITAHDGAVKYQSEIWPENIIGINSTYTLDADNNDKGIKISIFKNIVDLEASLTNTRNTALIIAFFTTIVLAGLFLTMLQKETLTPLDKIGEELRNILHNNKELGQTLEVIGNTEIRVLTSNFNEMVTNLKDSYEKIETARDGAIEANIAKSQFLANMSHELRTPLNAVIGYSDMLKEDPRISESKDLTNDIKKIRSAADHLLKLINEVLDLSKIEAGKMELSLEPFKVSLAVRDICDTISPIIQNNGNKLTINCPKDIGDMHADITKFRQTLYNILSNANKFTNKGEISLTMDRYFESGREYINFYIKDTGIGIPKDQIPKLFTAFSQVDQTHNRKFIGTGLGLVISKRFCYLMGGDISVTSVFGKGSNFCVKLPVKVMIEESNKIVSMDGYSSVVSVDVRASRGRS